MIVLFVFYGLYVSSVFKMVMNIPDANVNLYILYMFLSGFFELFRVIDWWNPSGRARGRAGVRRRY